MAANAGETKVKLWEGICYPENMRDDWQDEIDDILQVPFAYAVHDIDHDQKSKQRKTHAHVIVVGHYTNKDGKLVVGRVEPRESEPNWGTVESRIERVNEAQKAAGKRATRKDAVVMADVVVTLPDNVRKCVEQSGAKE